MEDLDVRIRGQQANLVILDERMLPYEEDLHMDSFLGASKYSPTIEAILAGLGISSDVYDDEVKRTVEMSEWVDIGGES